MRNVIYKVSFEVNPLLDGEFDFKEEALAWANDHLADKPVVKAVDIEYSDEFGGEPVIHEEEEIFHYPVENVISDEDEDYLAARLAELERDALEADPYGADEFDGHEEFKEDTISETDQVAANHDEIHEEIKEEELIEEDFVLFDPFGCDFSECEPMEVCKDEHRADCCDDICQSPADFLKELAAELGIEDEVEISEKECTDDSCEEKPEDEIPCEDCKDEISEISDEVKIEEPVVAEDEVKVDVAPEAEVAAEEDIVPEEVKANEEPNVEVQAEDEKPAEEISKCHVCPECGKEICECDKQKLVEAENLIDDTEGKDDLINALREDTHPEEAQPEVDHVKAFNAALEVAKKENKPVIYGYMGADHHGKNRYFEIEHIVCDDLAQCRDEVMKKYHPNGSVLVAYPDKDFAEEFDPRNCDLENKELFIEDKEMSDEEFAEALKKGLEEKHCQK